MSTTSVTPAAAERASANKPAQAAKPNGQSNSTPGQFAALMLLQADEEPTSAVADTTAQAPAEDADTERPKADERTPADAAQLALQALLDWRGVISGSQANTPQAATANPGNTPDGRALERSGAPLTDAITPLVSEGTSLVPSGLALDGGTNPNKPAQKPDSAGTLLANTGAWAPPSPNDTELQAALAKATEQQPPAADTTRTQQAPAAVNAGWADTGAASPLSKTRPGSAKANAIGSVRTGTVAMAEATAGAQATANTGKMPETVGHIRSTLGLAGRSDATENPAPNTAEQAGALEPTAVTGPQGPDATAGEGIQQAEIPAPSPTAPDATPAPEAFADMFQQHMDDLGAQISYWSAQGAQRASFTIGSAEDGPLEVKLSFTDGELAVSFETDEESVREVLQNGAQEALQRLMDAQGIALGNVSVGGGRANTPQDNASERPTVELAQRGRGLKTATTDTPVATTPRAPNIMTATKLDFYA